MKRSQLFQSEYQVSLKLDEKWKNGSKISDFFNRDGSIDAVEKLQDEEGKKIQKRVEKRQL